jgi:hypothetical protein
MVGFEFAEPSDWHISIVFWRCRLHVILKIVVASLSILQPWMVSYNRPRSPQRAFLPARQVDSRAVTYGRFSSLSVAPVPSLNMSDWMENATCLFWEVGIGRRNIKSPCVCVHHNIILSDADKKTESRIQEAFLNKLSSWKWRQRDYCWQIHLRQN